MCNVCVLTQHKTTNNEWEGYVCVPRAHMLRIFTSFFFFILTKFQVNSRILVILHKFTGFSRSHAQNAIFEDFQGLFQACGNPMLVNTKCCHFDTFSNLILLRNLGLEHFNLEQPLLYFNTYNCAFAFAKCTTR